MDHADNALGGPFICAALFCEKILKESDGVMTVVRIIDRFYVHGNTDEMQKIDLNFTILLSIKSGDFRGRYEISVQPITPSGKPLPKLSFPLNFEGDSDRGVRTVAPARLEVDEEGVFWFDVKCGEQLLTRMPLKILYRQSPKIGSGGSR